MPLSWPGMLRFSLVGLVGKLEGWKGMAGSGWEILGCFFHDFEGIGSFMILDNNNSKPRICFFHGRFWTSIKDLVGLNAIEECMFSSCSRSQK